MLVDIKLDPVEKAAALIKQRYPNVKAIAVKADVGKEADVKAAVDRAVAEFGRLDVMVCVILVIRIAGDLDPRILSSTMLVCRVGSQVSDYSCRLGLSRYHAPR